MIKPEKAATKIMAVIGTAVMLFLLFYSWKYTKRLVEPEYYLDEKDSIFTHLAISVALLFLCGVLAKTIRKIPKKILHAAAVVIALTAAGFGILLARDAGATAQADQYYIQRAAQALADGDMSWVLEQDYYRIYPFQLGFAQICAFFFKIAGSSELAVLQYVQAVCCGITLYAGFRIVRELSDDRAAELFYLAAGSLFMPLYCYALFIYGESIGTCCAMCAIWCYLVLHRQEKDSEEAVGGFLGRFPKGAVLWGITGILMCIAYTARNVLLVVCIAMLITEILAWFREKKWQGIVAVCCVLLLMIAGKSVLCNLAQRQIGQDYGSGAPYLLWVAMGMQENPEIQKGPGTYNDYNLDVYLINGYDSDKSTERAKADIRERLAEWKADPAAAVQFLKEKILIQWIEPTYGGFNQTRYFYRPKEWVERLYTGEENESVLKFLNYYQGVMYLMILGYYVRILFGKFGNGNLREEKVHNPEFQGEKLLPGILFLGGFFITVLWEAKSRYVYPYIVMIMPCAACSPAYYGSLSVKAIKKAGNIIGRTVIEKRSK